MIRQTISKAKRQGRSADETRLQLWLGSFSVINPTHAGVRQM